MDLQDINGWTYGFMEKNETECMKYIIALQNDALDRLQEGNCNEAVLLYYDIICGVEKLCALDQDYYEPSLYAVLYATAKIEAFQLEDREKAIELLKKACKVAKRCSEYDRTEPAIAEKDLEVMNSLLLELQVGASVSVLKAKDTENTWNLTNYSAFSSFQLDNTISSIGCLIIIAILIALCILYSIVTTSNPNP